MTTLHSTAAECSATLNALPYLTGANLGHMTDGALSSAMDATLMLAAMQVRAGGTGYVPQKRPLAAELARRAIKDTQALELAGDTLFRNGASTTTVEALAALRLKSWENARTYTAMEAEARELQIRTATLGEDLPLPGTCPQS